MNCVTTINGREAVPVRAIPFITGWKTFSPDAVAMGLAQRCDWGRLEGLTAYHVAEHEGFHEMLPKEWDGVASELSALSKLLKKDDPEAEVSYPEWRKKSISCLPSHCFVWLDEFERVYERAMVWLHIHNERTGDKQLNFHPRIPTDLVQVVLEGLPAPITAEAFARMMRLDCGDRTPTPAPNSLNEMRDHEGKQSPVEIAAEIAKLINRLPYQPRMLKLVPEVLKLMPMDGVLVKQDSLLLTCYRQCKTDPLTPIEK